jgi:cell division protein FtsB
VKRISSNKYNIFNKKAQVGETLTWAIATLIIIVVLIVFIYASVGMAKTKGVFSKSTDSEEASAGQSEWITLKNALAFSVNNKNQKEIEEWLDERDIK